MRAYRCRLPRKRIPSTITPCSCKAVAGTIEAVTYFTRAMDEAKDLLAFNNLGDLYCEMGRYDDAFLCYVGTVMHAAFTDYTECVHEGYVFIGHGMDNLAKVKPHLSKSVEEAFPDPLGQQMTL